MYTIITYLLAQIQELNKLVLFLFKFIVKNIPLNNLSKGDDKSLSSPKYRKLNVDELPKIIVPEKKDYKVLIKNYSVEHDGKILKPIKHRGNFIAPKNLHCPCCNAPSDYIYDNTGGRGQYWCKVCDTHFNKQNIFDNDHIYKCPYCNHSLVLHKVRKNFNVHRCVNLNCNFYLNALANLSNDDKLEYQQHPERFKLHYFYREFDANLFKLDLYNMPKNISSLNFRKFSPEIMGLCLTYNVNCGLSTRKTSRVLWEVHGIKISHVQVANYAYTASLLIKPFVDNFDYNPSNFLAADETYTKVKGSKRYVWFVMDAIKKSILGYHSSEDRDTIPCILTLRMAFDKFKQFPGKTLKFVADGYNSYKLAEQQFKLHNMNFDVTQVIGLTNEDPVSTEYRWLKQNIERLNRTFKFSYKVTNGYGSDSGADSHIALFVAYYNFLRPHHTFKNDVLNHIPELDNIELMPAKWQMLIKLSEELIISKQTT